MAYKSFVLISVYLMFLVAVCQVYNTHNVNTPMQYMHFFRLKNDNFSMFFFTFLMLKTKIAGTR